MLSAEVPRVLGGLRASAHLVLVCRMAPCSPYGVRTRFREPGRARFSAIRLGDDGVAD